MQKRRIAVRKNRMTETNEATDTLLDRVEGRLAEDGIEPFDNANVAEDYLKLPRDITEVPSQELGRYLNAFTQQKMWNRTLIGRTKAELRDLENQLNAVRMRVYADLPVKMSIKEKETHVRSHAEAGKLMADLDYYVERLNMLGDYIENIIDAIFNISREISRRGSDMNDDRREDNVGRKRRG